MSNAIYHDFLGALITLETRLVERWCKRKKQRTTFFGEKRWKEKGVINDPLGQTHSLASSEHCFLLFCFARFEKWGRTYGRTDVRTCAKTMMPTCPDCPLAEWIKRDVGGEEENKIASRLDLLFSLLYMLFYAYTRTSGKYFAKYYFSLQ